MEIKIDINEAKRYMGYGGISPESIDGEQERVIRELAEQLERVIKPAWVYRLFGIESTEEGLRLAGTSLTLTGADIRQHLEGCGNAVLLCATASAKADEFIRRKQAEDMALGFMADCLGSAAVEAVCNALEAELSEKLTGRFLTWRFSPGYGDLPLDIQPKVLDVLGAPKRAGVTCLDSLLMVPSKTVTAVIGVSDKPLEKKRSGCATCNMRDRCTFGKGGTRCGL